MLRATILLLSFLLAGTAVQAQVKLPTMPSRVDKQPAAPSAAVIENAAWQACANARTAGPCDAYLRDYPRGSFAGVARTRGEDIRRAQAEAARRAEEQRAAARERPAPVAPVVDREPRLWATCEASTTVAACTDYLGAFPSGPSADKARARITALNAAAAEKAAFAQCQASTSPGLCETFVATYPNSNLVAAAKAQSAVIASQGAARAAAERQQAEERLAAEKRQTEARLAAEKQQAEARLAAEREAAAQRDAAQKAQAAAEQDKTAFTACRDGNSAADCQAYLAAAPNGAFRAQAQAKALAIESTNKEKAAFDICRNGATAAPCRDFGRDFPTSANAGEAARLARERDAAASAAAAETAAWALCEPGQSTVQCEKYLALYAAGPHAQAAQAIVARIRKDEADKLALEQEQAAWDLCRSAAKTQPCDDYLQRFPAGRFVGAAKTRAQEILTGPTEDQAVAPLGLVVKRNTKSQLEIVSVQGNSSAIGQVFGGDIITTINDKPYDPRIEPKAALDAAIAEDNGRVELLITRGAVPVSKVLRARR